MSAPGARARYDLPAERRRDRDRARRLEWVTIGFMLSIITLLYFTLGSSQAMKTAWVEDILSLIPPIAFLVATRFESRAPTERFPYGFRRAVAIAFLCGAVALTAMGAFLLYEAVMTLLMKEHPTIGTVEVFGRQVWLGWLMMASLVYSVIPPVILGRMKQPLAKRMHDKALAADADMNRADWLTGLAAIAGIFGIAMGWWWADAAAAAVISLDILHDGWKNLTQVVRDLMDERPTPVGETEPDPLPRRMEERLLAMEWVEDAAVRLREEGHVLTGEAFVVPRGDDGLVEKLDRAGSELKALDWRLYDLSVVPVRTLRGAAPAPDGRQPAEAASARGGGHDG